MEGTIVATFSVSVKSQRETVSYSSHCWCSITILLVVEEYITGT